MKRANSVYVGGGNSRRSQPAPLHEIYKSRKTTTLLNKYEPVLDSEASGAKAARDETKKRRSFGSKSRSISGNRVRDQTLLGFNLFSDKPDTNNFILKSF